MKQEIPPWWRDVDRSVSQGIMKYEFAAARLEALLAEASDGKSAVPGLSVWENLLAEIKTAGEQVARSLTLASSRRRDVKALGLIPPSSRDLAASAQLLSAKFHAISASIQERLAHIRDELRQLGRPRNRSGMSASPSQIDVRV